MVRFFLNWVRFMFRFYYCASAVLDRTRRHRGRRVIAAQPLRSQLKQHSKRFCYIDFLSSVRSAIPTFVFRAYPRQFFLKKNEVAGTHSFCACLFVTLLELGVLSSGFSPCEFLRRKQRRWRLPGMLNSVGPTLLCALLMLCQMRVVV